MKCLFTLEGHQHWVTSVAVTIDSSKLISGSRDNTVKVWCFSSRECLSTLEGHQDRVTSVAVTADGSIIISGSRDSTVKVWCLSSRECLLTLVDHKGWVNTVAVTPDGSKVISGSQDETAKVWRLSNGECLFTLEGHRCGVISMAVTPDSFKIINGSEAGDMRVWCLLTGHCLFIIQQAHRVFISTLTVTPDGSKIISGNHENALKVWSLSTGECFSTLEGHRHGVNSVAMTADGSRIVCGSDDRTVKICPIFAHPQNSIVFSSIRQLVEQFSSHMGSEALMHHVFTLFPKLSLMYFVSEDGKRCSTYLCRAIELGASDEMLTALFKVHNPYLWLNLLHRGNCEDLSTPRNILELLMDLRREQSLRLVLDQIVFGFDQHNQVRMGKLALSQSSWRITPEVTSSPAFTSFLCRLVEQYPQLAEDFLSKIGAVKTFVGVDAQKELDRTGPETVISLKSCLPEDCGFLVAGGNSFVPLEGLWKDSLGMERSSDGESLQIVESRMLPFTFAGGDPNTVSDSTHNDQSQTSRKWRTPSLLHAIVKSNHP